ncbi:MAG: response regulator transcription factor [Solirubrobacteraceae bacterium]
MELDSPTILIVEDHHATRRFLADNLSADGYEPLEAGSVTDGRRAMAERSPDLVIVDLGLPDGEGLDLVSEVRAAIDGESGLDALLPVVILSGRGTELDRIRGFERGCDDYLSKPFSYAELRGRIQALLRRSRARPRVGRVRVGTLVLDPVSRDVWVGDRRVALSKKEFGLVRTLASEPTRVFTREELLRDVWGYQSRGATRTLDSHASRLRKKLGGGSRGYVVNVWGVGYRLIDPRPGR